MTYANGTISPRMSRKKETRRGDKKGDRRRSIFNPGGRRGRDSVLGEEAHNLLEGGGGTG